METITITHRIKNGKSIFNKRFDDYDKGIWGMRISKSEYQESKEIAENRKQVPMSTIGNKTLQIIESICYEN